MANQQTKQLQSIFPDLPREGKAVESDGSLTNTWRLSISSVYQSLQRNFSNEGYQIPPLSESNIDTIESKYSNLIGKPLPQNLPNISGRMVYDSTTSVPKMFIITFDASNNVTAASWKTFTLT